MNSTQFITEAHEYSKGKVCGKCKEHLPLSEYHKKTRAKDGLQYKCKSCQKEYDDNMCPFKKWFSASPRKSEAKVRGTEFTIEPTDIPGVKIREVITTSRKSYESKDRKYVSWEAVEYPKVCPVLGIELDWGKNGRQPNSPSLDRIDPTKGYIPGNVMMISDLANSMKNNATPEQLNQFSRYHLFGDNK